MREPGYYWVHTGGEPFIARWSGKAWFGHLLDEGVTVISERIPVPGEPCTCEAAKRATWRPIGEVHEDFGTVVLIDIDDPGRIELEWPGRIDIEDCRWTHFAEMPSLTHEMAEKLKGGQ